MLEVTLHAGVSFAASASHCVFVRTDDGFEGWRRVADLDPADFVGIHRGIVDFGGRTMDADEAYAVGVVLARGHATHEALLVDAPGPVVQRILPVVQRWQGWCGPPGRNLALRPKDSGVSLSAAGSFVRFLRDTYGLERNGPDEGCRVPAAIRSGTRAVVGSFVRGYFEARADYRGSIVVSTQGEAIATELHHLLFALGVFARRPMGRPLNLEVIDREAFVSKIGRASEFVREHEDVAVPSEPTNMDVVPGIAHLLRAATRGLPEKSRRRALQARSGSFRTSYARLRRLLEYLPDNPATTELERIESGFYVWSRPVSVRAVTVPCFPVSLGKDDGILGNSVLHGPPDFASKEVAQ